MAAEIDEELKRHVNELIALCRLEPSEKFLFVEGPSDRRLLRWFFHATNRSAIHVSEINVVRFERDDLEQLNLDRRSNKEKVIGLMTILAKSDKAKRNSVYGLVDLDTEGFLGLKSKEPALLRTDFTSIELYFFDAVPIEKFFELVLHGFPIEPTELLNQMAPVLEMAFYARLANEQFGLRCDWLDISRCCKIEGNRVRFDAASWVKRYLQKCSQYDCLNRFKTKMKEFERRRNADPRLQMHGHDFMNLLGWMITKLKNRFGLFRDPECLARALIACVELEFIEAYPLFAELRRIF